MIYRLYEVKVQLDYKEKHILSYILQNTGIKKEDIESFKVVKRSIDARHTPKYNLTIEIVSKSGFVPKKSKHLQIYNPPKISNDNFNIINYKGLSPIIIGAGPAGLMAALVLAENGLKPVIYERGADTETRTKQVNDYLATGNLNPESNIMYGEGGAGLFSDGKLTARSKEAGAIKYFLETLVKCGAPESILLDAEPHLGSDLLSEIIPVLRKLIISKGGEIHFNSRVSDLEIKNNEITGVVVNNNLINTNHCILATGHSARDMYKLLSEKKISMKEKSFAMGVRLEIPQEFINKSQYGKYFNHPGLGAASFRLTRRPEKSFRACYTFCMCPGGEILPCSSSEGMLTSNGMSLSKRDGKYANAAFIVPVNPDDYKKYRRDEYPNLGGVFFQEHYERKVFKNGGENYSLPASRLSDFLGKQGSTSLPDDTQCKRVVATDIHTLLPKFINKTLRYSIPKMVPKFGRMNFEDISVYCAETRSSSPVRIERDKDQLMSTSTKGLFPCGEGSGYTGGIVSSALDGIKIAKSILKNYIKV